MAEHVITIGEFNLNLAEFNPDSAAAGIVGDVDGVTLTLPDSYTVALPELGIGELTIGRLQLRLAAGLVRQLVAALPAEVVH